MLQFGLRLGARPRQLITTTPRPIPLIKRLLADPRTAVTRAATQANAAHLSPAFLDEVLARYAGTRLGRQEIDGEIIEDRADALWTRALIEAARVPKAPPLLRIVVGIDPPGSARPGADACGIVAAGIAEDGTIYVLEDATVQGLAPPAGRARRWRCSAGSRPTRWSPRSTRAATWCAPCSSRSTPRCRCARCTRRAANGCAPSRWRWYQQGKVKHVDPPMPALEDEMCDFGLGGLSSGRSPDRLDALVWAVTDLMKRGAGPRITVLSWVAPYRDA